MADIQGMVMENSFSNASTHTSEDSLENDRINFQKTLRFFQEQLVTKGNAPLSPICTTLPTENNGKISLRSTNAETNTETPPNTSALRDNCSQTFDICNIPQIPTVDTILESVRVLRAIQKSQQQRGSSFNLDISSSNSEKNDECNQLVDENSQLFDENKQELSSKEVTDNEISKTSKINGILKEHHENIIRSESSCTFWPKYVFSKENIDNTTKTYTDNDVNKTFLNVDTNVTPKITNTKETEYNSIDYSHELNNSFDVIQASATIMNVQCTKFVNQTTSTYTKTTETLSVIDGNEATISSFDNEKEITEVVENGIPLENDQIFVSNDVDSVKCIAEKIKDEDHLHFLEDSMSEESLLDKTEDRIPRSVDCDSGIGTDKSLSSSSPTHHTQSQRNSWSDTSSSHYVSAECSPCHSLNSVFDAPTGLSDAKGRRTPSVNVEEQNRESSNQDEEAGSSCAGTSGQSFEKGKINEVSSISTASTPEVLEKREISYVTSTSIDSEESEATASTVRVVPNDIAENDDEIDAPDNHKRYRSFNSIELKVASPAESDQNQSNCNGACAEGEIDDHFQRADTNENETSNDEKIDVKNFTDTLLISISENEFKMSQRYIEDKESMNNQDLLDLDEAEHNRKKKHAWAKANIAFFIEEIYKDCYNAPTLFPTKIIKSNNNEEFILNFKGITNESKFGLHQIGIKDSRFILKKDDNIIFQSSLKYAKFEVNKNIFKLDNKLGRILLIEFEQTNECYKVIAALNANIGFNCQNEVVHFPMNTHKKIIVIDLGSSSIRAGIVMDQPVLPSLFLPTIGVLTKDSNKCLYGLNTLKQHYMQDRMIHPFKLSEAIEKYTIEIKHLESLFHYICKELQVNPSEYIALISTSRNLSNSAQKSLVELLLNKIGFKAVNLSCQVLLTLYSYDAKTGILVNMGNRTEIVPVVEGFVIRNGCQQKNYGGETLHHHMKQALAKQRLSCSKEATTVISRFINENMIYVAENFDQEQYVARENENKIKKNLAFQLEHEGKLIKYNIKLCEERFSIAEGFFNPFLWGLDSPGMHKLIQKAVQETSMDNRKDVLQNILLSGGITKIPGFEERLIKELNYFYNGQIKPKVFASPYREHCSYIGACKLAIQKGFKKMCINKEEFDAIGDCALQKFSLNY